MLFPKRKIIFVLGFFFLLGIVALVVVSKQRTRVLETPLPTSKKPEFSKDSKTNLPITVEPQVKMETPESLPLMTIALKDLSLESSETTAKNLGFASSAQEIKDALDGTKYTWFNDKNYLWITPQKSQIRFGMTQLSEKQTLVSLSDSDMEKIVMNFVKQGFGIASESISVSSISYLSRPHKGSEDYFSETSKEQAEIIHFNLTYNNIGYPVLTSIPRYQILFVEILGNGEIYKAESFVVDKVTRTDEKYKLKTFDEIKISLYGAHLVDLENDYISLADVKPSDLSDIEVEKAEIGYYFDDINMITTLQPIFLLDASLKVRNSSANRAKLYIPAIQE